MKGITNDCIDIILGSWRNGTKSQHQAIAKKWFAFCNSKSCCYFSPPLSMVFQFLSELFHCGSSYSYINTARSALSSMLSIQNSSIPLGQLPIVK